jgi:hypothetical protein
MMEDPSHNAPTFKLDPRTLVFDAGELSQIAWIEGLLPLPTGARLEFGSGQDEPQDRFDAVVTRTRVLVGMPGNEGPPMQLCLDVMKVGAGESLDVQRSAS